MSRQRTHTPIRAADAHGVDEDDTTDEPVDLVLHGTILHILMAFAWFVGVVADSLVLRLLVKPTATLALLPLIHRRSTYGDRVRAGVVCSALGDLLLELGPAYQPAGFQLGMVAFFCAHVFYLAAFCHRSQARRLDLCLPWLVNNSIALAVIWPGFTTLDRFSVPLYVGIIGLMAWRAAAAVPLTGPLRGPALRGAIGAAVFALSDMMIALNRWVTPLGLGGRIAILGSYWLAQVLIVLSTHPRGASPLSARTKLD